MQLGLYVMVGVILGCASCRRVPNVPDLFQPSEFGKSFEDRLRSESTAPIIVVGTVKMVQPLGRPRKSDQDSRIVAQLTKLTIEVEQSVRGVGRGRLEFYYNVFSSDSQLDRGLQRYLPSPGQRRMYFLKPFEGGYRSIGDVADYTLPVRSGYHDQDLCRGESVGCCIAKILLVPGEGCEKSSFAVDLVSNVYVAGILCSRSVALELVRKLRQSPDREIALAAEDILAAAAADGEL